MFLNLLPILWSDGIGADVMKRIAVPMVGGIVTSSLPGRLALLTSLIAIPLVHAASNDCLWPSVYAVVDGAYLFKARGSPHRADNFSYVPESC
jgi:hypothetical protein